MGELARVLPTLPHVSVLNLACCGLSVAGLRSLAQCGHDSDPSQMPLQVRGINRSGYRWMGGWMDEWAGGRAGGRAGRQILCF